MTEGQLVSRDAHKKHGAAHLRTSSTLIFTTCYNERENIGLLIDGIVAAVPDADILVVDDRSPDGTWDIIQLKAAEYPQLRSVQRPGKLGIGSAHKYALYYAMREGYTTVVTMDADFSHDPASLPDLLKAHAPNTFVTGSRYCKGGRSDYSGYRDVVSRLGNIAARSALGVRLKELTTYFRVFDVQSLRRLPLREISASGYSYGVELIYHLRKAGVELREVPIHFVDRTRGASKIPRLQVFMSAFDLLRLAAKRFSLGRDLKPDEFVDDACVSCGDKVLAMKHFGSARSFKIADADESQFRCTSVGAADYPPVFTCLACGLEQVPSSLVPPQLSDIYEDVVDHTYLQNIKAREKTYTRAMDAVQHWTGLSSGSLLEVGAYCGLFQLAARGEGWDPQGVEPSVWASEYAREVSKVDVKQGFLAERKAELRPEYDAVVSWDVIEHVPQPVEFIKECGEFLRPGSCLFLSTMDVGARLPRLLGTRWPWLINMHIVYFSEKSMKSVLENAGFDLVGTQDYVHYARVRHILNGAQRVVPAFLRPMVQGVASMVPDAWTVPFSFGDIKLFVARKSYRPQ